MKRENPNAPFWGWLPKATDFDIGVISGELVTQLANEAKVRKQGARYTVSVAPWRG